MIEGESGGEPILKLLLKLMFIFILINLLHLGYYVWQML